MSDYYDETLTMGQRIMNHKFAKMSIWEFLGWKPKKPKEEKMTWLEAEEEIWKNRLKLEIEAGKRELNRKRTSAEWDNIYRYAENCRKVMFMLGDEFRAKSEWDEEWKQWVLAENTGACLPICYGEVLKKMKADNKYLPSTHMLLI